MVNIVVGSRRLPWNRECLKPKTFVTVPSANLPTSLHSHMGLVWKRLHEVTAGQGPYSLNRP